MPTRAAHTDILDAYDMLHRLGLRVELTRQTDIRSLAVPGVILAPGAGARVPRGSIIKITPTGGPVGSPAVLKSNPHYRVPNFAGHPLSDAVSWATRHDIYWAIPRLPALHASAAPHLFDAYRITSQQPKPDGTIVQGVMVGRTFTLTPLTLTVESN